MTNVLDKELARIRKRNCCSTTNVVNLLSRCLCVKNSKTATAPLPRELAEVEKEMFIQKRFFEE